MIDPVFIVGNVHQVYAFNALNITAAWRNGEGTNVEGKEMKERHVPVNFEKFIAEWRERLLAIEKHG